MAELTMKVSLVVASGVHQGKAIPIVTPQFLIGRDPTCQLRPASQAVSKQHCAVLIRDGKVYVKDLGSTNGTQLNDATLNDEEREVRPNDSLKVGPLDFTVRIEPTSVREDGTPLPERSPEAAAALAAVKAAVGSAPATPARNATPNPTAKPALTGSKEEKSPPRADEQDDHDRLAAMLLGMDDGPADVPGGSTVVDVPASALAGGPADPAAAGKPAEKKPDTSKQDTVDAASDLLRKYMRRPK